MDLCPYQHLPPMWADLAGHASVGASLLLIGLSSGLALWHRRRARQMASLVPAGEVVASARALVYGTVESSGDAPPLSVAITQQRKPSPYASEGDVAWVEVERKVTGQPFYVRLSPQQRIRVEPDAATILIGPPFETVEVDASTRIRRSELRPGSAVHVRGAIVAGDDPAVGYRGAPALVLRPGPGLMVSTVGMDHVPRIRARRYALALAGVLVLSLVNLVLLDYFRARYGGQVVRTEVVQPRLLKEKTATRSMVALRILPAQPHAGHVFERQVWDADYPGLRPGMEVPARLIVGDPDSAGLGSRASFKIVLLVPLFLALVVALALLVRGSRPAGWWEFPLIED